MTTAWIRCLSKLFFIVKTSETVSQEASIKIPRISNSFLGVKGAKWIQGQETKQGKKVTTVSLPGSRGREPIPGAYGRNGHVRGFAASAQGTSVAL